MRFVRILIATLFLFQHSVISAATDASEVIVPELDSDLNKTSIAHGKKAMVVTANKHATRAALNTLQLGGSAIDAAVAAQVSLGLVEPQSSGIGGGAFLLYWDNKTKQLTYYDGRETAPNAMTSQHFMTAPDKPMKFYDAVIGGHSVGVPGVVRMLEDAQKNHGKLPWSSLFSDTVRLAGQGFTLSPRLYELLSRASKRAPIDTNPDIKNYLFGKNGLPLPVGSRLRNPAYANSLKLIATEGASVFYEGKIAKEIIKKLHSDPFHKSLMTLSDLKNYKTKIRQPSCGQFRKYTVCGAAPPSSGGTTVLSILGILNHFDLTRYEVNSPELIHLFAESSKLAFADRNQYIGDPDFLDYSTLGLLNASYIASRARLINMDSASKALPGIPPGIKKHAGFLLNSGTLELPSTSHFSIVDQWGNAVSMTTSIETAFGSRVMVGGFILNNQLTDFSFRPTKNNKQVANSVEGNKRPRSSMSPTIVFNRDKTLKLIVGSPGGSRIIDYTAQAIVYHLAKDLSLAQAINAPHVVHNNGNYLELEKNYFSTKSIAALEKKGHRVKQNAQTSGIHAITFSNGEITGVADPRREGMALGY